MPAHSQIATPEPSVGVHQEGSPTTIGVMLTHDPDESTVTRTDAYYDSAGTILSEVDGRRQRVVIVVEASPHDVQTSAGCVVGGVGDGEFRGVGGTTEDEDGADTNGADDGQGFG